MRPRNTQIRQNDSSNHVQGMPRRHKPDYILLIIALILISFGLVLIYSIGPGLVTGTNLSQNYYINRQMISVALGACAFMATAFLPFKFWIKSEKFLISIAIISALLVRVFGQRVNGAYRWIQVGGFSFQSSELLKFTLLIWLAGFLSLRVKDGTIKDFKKTLLPVGIVLIALLLVVAGVQSDLGSTTVMIFMIVAMVFVAGLPMKKIVLIGLVVAFLVFIAIITSSYRQQRVATFLHPSSNCQTTGYQTCQAMIAVGSGGMIGLGLGQSVQAYGYLPEAANDSIFAIFAEKFGFIGCSIFLLLFAALFTRLKHIIDRCPNNFTRLIVVGILAWLSVQTFINVGAMVGILPLKGITLPFISYGGSSMIFVMAAIGLVFYISRYTLHTVPTKEVGRNDYDNSRNGGRIRRTRYSSLGGR